MFSLFQIVLFVLHLLPSLTQASPHHFSPKPAYFLLAGDSTTATQSVGGGGWGDGFLNYTLKSGSSGRNYGHNGATTKSFREGGDWARVISDAKTKIGDYTVYVTIQFGHNDQKNTSGVSLEEYSGNLEAFAKEVKEVGGIPIFVTSLTRRKYNTATPPEIKQDLEVQRNLTLAAAQATRSRHIDLNIASTNYCNAIGPDAAWEYNLNPTDYTHLNVHGSVVFGRMELGGRETAMPTTAPANPSKPHDVRKKLWALVKQRRIRDLVTAIKEIVRGDIQHLAAITAGRKLNFKTFVLVCNEAGKTHTGCVAVITLAVDAVVACIVVTVYPWAVATPLLNALGFTGAGPAAGSVTTAAQSTFGVGPIFGIMKSAAMSGYGGPVVAAVIFGVAVAIAVFVGVKLWSARKNKTV
ncbi:esterase [Aureobasidium subglaciale]|nr:esterase [Aureobasidium subglaciale]